jgi:CubicO group peptidase (beta-lactamase class C family)
MPSSFTEIVLPLARVSFATNSERRSRIPVCLVGNGLRGGGPLASIPVQALRQIDRWGSSFAAAAVVVPGGVVAVHGDESRIVRWASLTKLLTAYSALVATERGMLELDEPAGPPGSTLRHLLAHASGLPFVGSTPIARPGERRIYSNCGFERAAEHLSERVGMPFEDWLAASVLGPLGIDGRLEGSPAAGFHGTLQGLIGFAQELLEPQLLRPATFATATRVQFPGLGGVLPGVGRFEPNDWGLGFELRDDKRPHWTGRWNSRRTFCHFGGSGTFLWVDPAQEVALACLSSREFDDWALDAWPALSDAVLAELARREASPLGRLSSSRG